MVVGAPKNAECCFRAKGKVEWWNPWTGQAQPLHVVSATPEGTRVRMPLDKQEAQLIVFTPGELDLAVEKTDLDEVTSIERKDGRVVVSGFARAAGGKSAVVRAGTASLALKGEAVSPPTVTPVEGPWEFQLSPTPG